MTTTSTTPTTTPPGGAQIAQDIATTLQDGAEVAEKVVTATWWTALLGFLTALPGLVQLGLGFIKWFNKVTGNNPSAWIAKNGPAWTQLFNATTPEETQSAAQNIAGLIHSLPSD